MEPDHDHGGLKGRAAADSRPDAPSAHERRPSSRSPARRPRRREDSGARVCHSHAWLDSWSGLGLIVLGMHRHGYDLSLTHDRNGWRATFLHRSHVLYPWVGPGAALVANTVACGAGGRVAGAQHADGDGLLAHGRVAAVGISTARAGLPAESGGCRLAARCRWRTTAAVCRAGFSGNETGESDTNQRCGCTCTKMFS